MSVSPISPTEPEPSWQPPRKQVTFNNEIEYYGGTYSGTYGGAHGGTHDGTGLVPVYAKKDDDDDAAVELGNLQVNRSREAQDRWKEEQAKRKRMVCCLSKKTFIILVVVTVFLLGATLGGVSATLINKKKKDGDNSAAKASATPKLGAFPTITHVPVPTPR